MNAAIDENLCIPTDMIPRCPKCSAQMEPWVRGYTFLELGVGRQNRMIKEPFMNLAASEPEAVYITFNKGEVYIPSEIAGKSIGVDGDIGEALKGICLCGQ